MSLNPNEQFNINLIMLSFYIFIRLMTLILRGFFTLLNKMVYNESKFLILIITL